MQEQAWENYATTKERVYDIIAAAIGRDDASSALEEACKIEITCCSRIGHYQLNKPQPISVTFQCKDDKQCLLKSKRNLPARVYLNEEFPAHMKRNQDILRPILKLAKSIPEYQERCRMQGDKLLINGTHYSMNDLARLPPELATFKAAQKTDSESIVFHGELSPYSNFHYTPFKIDGQEFSTSEHYIQYCKAMYFRDKFTANAILNSSTPYEAKKLSYQINGINTGKW